MRAQLVVGCLLAAPVLAGCGQQEFRDSEPLRITAPADRTVTDLPVRVAWSNDSDGEGSYLVVVDRSPQPPGESVRHFFKDDDDCKGTRVAVCLAPDYLQTRGIYLTSEPTITIEALARNEKAWDSAKLQHDVVVVRLDSDGRRVGESFSAVRFSLRDDPFA